LGEKPTAALVLCLIGGIFILLGGVFQAFLGALISGIGTTTTGTNVTGVGSTIGILGILGIVFGIVVMVAGIMMYTNPGSHTMWGVIALVLSLVSFATSSIGGFVIGFLLTLIGGILGIVFKPSMMHPAGMGSMPMGSQSMGPPGAPMSSMTSIKCPACGASVAAGTTKCPNCGAML
jgi:Family of unknown function (DUF6114)/zinc-ribbon domain